MIREIYNDLRVRAEREKKEAWKKPSESIAFKPITINEHQLKKEREESEEYKKQIALFEELRELGIIGMIEEFTEEKMGTFIGHDGVERVAMIDSPWWNGDFLLSLPDDEAADRLDGHVWTIETDGPLLQDNGIWHPNIRIALMGMSFRDYPPSTENGIILSYSPNKEITIAGKDIIYKGVIPENIRILEPAIAEALVKPMGKREISRRLNNPELLTGKIIH